MVVSYTKHFRAMSLKYSNDVSERILRNLRMLVSVIGIPEPEMGSPRAIADQKL